MLISILQKKIYLLIRVKKIDYYTHYLLFIKTRKALLGDNDLICHKKKKKLINSFDSAKF